MWHHLCIAHVVLRITFTFEEDGGRRDKNIKGYERSETPVVVPILWFKRRSSHVPNLIAALSSTQEQRST